MFKVTRSKPTGEVGLLSFFFITFLLNECGIQFTHRILLHAWKDVRVNIHRHIDLCVAQQFLYDFRMDTKAQEKCRRTMT